MGSRTSVRDQKPGAETGGWAARRAIGERLPRQLQHGLPPAQRQRARRGFQLSATGCRRGLLLRQQQEAQLPAVAGEGERGGRRPAQQAGDPRPRQRQRRRASGRRTRRREERRRLAALRQHRHRRVAVAAERGAAPWKRLQAAGLGLGGGGGGGLGLGGGSGGGLGGAFPGQRTATKPVYLLLPAQLEVNQPDASTAL